ncbi:hypothetical protein AC578_2524 [Pseudocercospora eumusae]|uniref:BTB domain-containing protein n=1 Tax=Pseudocercospora eumusae TaxID=321146 RepID=A0A139GVY1_9PEZI|nr:hypothetical protein AC578_2524 [Pseudocercospora eumusae]
MAPKKAAHSDPLPSTPDAQHNNDDHYNRTIAIQVGQAHRTTKVYEIHRDLLKFYSGYFRTAIKNAEGGKFTEGIEGMIHLPDEDITVFDDFRRWFFAANRKIRPNSQGPAGF